MYTDLTMRMYDFAYDKEKNITNDQMLNNWDQLIKGWCTIYETIQNWSNGIKFNDNEWCLHSITE